MTKTLLTLGVISLFSFDAFSAAKPKAQVVFECVESEPMSDTALSVDLVRGSGKDLYLALGYWGDGQKHHKYFVPVFRNYDPAQKQYFYKSYGTKKNYLLRTDIVSSKRFTGTFVSDENIEIEVHCSLEFTVASQQQN